MANEGLEAAWRAEPWLGNLRCREVFWQEGFARVEECEEAASVFHNLGRRRVCLNPVFKE